MGRSKTVVSPKPSSGSRQGEETGLRATSRRFCKKAKNGMVRTRADGLKSLASIVSQNNLETTRGGGLTHADRQLLTSHQSGEDRPYSSRAGMMCTSVRRFVRP